jgi:DNA-binding response OmpR family regulator
MSIRVLVVEDDSDVAGLIRRSLERGAGMQVDLVEAGETALRSLSRTTPELVVLDWNLPGLSGLDVCRLMRRRQDTARIPIVMLTARGAEIDKVIALDAGADDYVTKPFGLRELAARVRAVLRRADQEPHSLAAPLVYRGAHLVADFDAVEIAVDGEPVRLTRREFELLRYLVEHRHRVVSRQRLREAVWRQDGNAETRSVDVHVSRLRVKLGAAGAQIETVIGLGYRFLS